MSIAASNRYASELEETVSALLQTGKGLLAADESFPTIEKRFKTIGLDSTEDARLDYRDLLFTTPHLSEWISGVILFDETLHQKGHDSRPFPQALAAKGMVPGIKVDAGTQPLPFFDGEKITAGLDGLRERLESYRGAGARFTKWRATIAIGDGLPTQGAIEANAQSLARFAALSQEAGLVPIVEPEVLMDGDHSLEGSEDATTQTLSRVFHALFEARVTFEHLLLKTGMVLSGKDSPQQANDEMIARATVRTLRRTVPLAVPGIVFLSGGQNELEATRRLNAINQHHQGGWTLTFSYGRALQESALKTWNGSLENIMSAQKVLQHRAKCNGLATKGGYSQAVESQS